MIEKLVKEVKRPSVLYDLYSVLLEHGYSIPSDWDECSEMEILVLESLKDEGKLN